MGFITVKNVTKQYSTKGPKVLDNINLSIEKGELVTLLGSSGCGKTTLLRCIAGLSEITSGSIFIEGRDCTHLSAGQRNVGMVFQQYSLFPNMTARENVAFGLKMLRKNKEVIREKTSQMLEAVQLLEKADSYPHQLSGGQQQRVALARAIITEPSVLLLDEPLSAIDAKVRKMLQDEIRRVQRAFNITTIFVTHDQHEAMVMSDRIFLMDKGVIVQEGTPKEIYTRPASCFAATFIGDNNVLTGQQFTRLTGVQAKCKYVALRPESIRLSQAQPDAARYCTFSAAVNDVVMNGTTIRYTLTKDGQAINVSALHDKSLEYQPGQTVWAAFDIDDCVMLEK